eukprot:SAG25_NODE_3263_length_1153_cov_1.597723_1_plen_44_part_10
MSRETIESRIMFGCLIMRPRDGQVESSRIITGAYKFNKQKFAPS